MTGYSTGANGDYVTIKYNSSGDSLWLRRADWGANDVATSISVDASGNVYVTGLSYRFSAYAYLTIKYNSSGVEKWVREYDGVGYDVAHSIGVDGSGNVYVTGYSAGSGTDDYLTIKYDSAGVEKWQRRYNGPGNSADTAYSLALDVSGNIYVTGTSTGSGTGTDYTTIKYNSSGDSLWVRRYNGPGNGSDAARTLSLDGSGNVYLTGASAGSGTGNDYATIKYNSSGVQQWVERYNGPGNGSDYAYSLALDGSGNVYVTGYSLGSGTGNDYATIKYSQTVGIEPISNEIPGEYNLSQNYPNPFNPNTIIRFKIKDSRLTTLKVFDVLGREVATLVNEQLQPGTYEVDWNADKFSSGVYYYKLVVDGSSTSSPQGFVETKKMILIK